MTVEFDEYAQDYNAGMSHPLKCLAGGTAASYIQPKVRWLLRDLDKWSSANCPSAPLRLLDVGCGSGSFLKCLQQNHFSGQLRGCDISESMLAEAARTWGEGAVPPLDLICNGELPYERQMIDVVIVCAVLHHVSINERAALFAEMARVLRPGGRLYIFEHNPWNPLTQMVVRTTDIDKNAILLTARKCRTLAQKVGMEVLSTDYLLFFPPRWEKLQRIEQSLYWLPMGAQYAVTAQLPSLLL